MANWFKLNHYLAVGTKLSKNWNFDVVPISQECDAELCLTT